MVYNNWIILPINKNSISIIFYELLFNALFY